MSESFALSNLLEHILCQVMSVEVLGSYGKKLWRLQIYTGAF